MVADNKTYCTGSLIHPQVVLTAGHCVWLREMGFNYTSSPSSVQVRTGGNVGFNGALGTALPPVKAAVAHPDWDGIQNESIDAEGAKVDMALLLLEEPVGSPTTYCLRTESAPAVGDDGLIVGYGLGGTGLFAATGTRRFGQTTLAEIWEHELKIGLPDSVCKGDSGGPLFTREGSDWKISGVASRGTAGCVPTVGAVFTSVAATFDWISEQVVLWTGEAPTTCTATGPGGDGDTGGGEDTEAATEPAEETSPPTEAETADERPEASDGPTAATELPATDTETDTSPTATVPAETDAVETERDSTPTPTDTAADSTNGQEESGKGSSSPGCRALPSPSGAAPSALALIASLL